jgi:prepilin-type N-terminal cleavage/methylation domain-containing protein
MEKRGLTFLELIVVLVVLAVVSTAGLVSFSQIDDRKLDSEARRIVSDICWVRELAMNTHKNYVINFDGINNSYEIYDSVVPSVKLRKTDLQVSFDTTFPLPMPLYFNGYWGIGPEVDYHLIRNGKVKRITVFGATGYVKVE